MELAQLCAAGCRRRTAVGEIWRGFQQRGLERRRQKEPWPQVFLLLTVSFKINIPDVPLRCQGHIRWLASMALFNFFLSNPFIFHFYPSCSPPTEPIIHTPRRPCLDIDIRNSLPHCQITTSNSPVQNFIPYVMSPTEGERYREMGGEQEMDRKMGRQRKGMQWERKRAKER